MEKWGKIRVIRVSGGGLDCNGLGKMTPWEGHLKVKELAMWISGGRVLQEEAMVSAKALGSNIPRLCKKHWQEVGQWKWLECNE